MNIETILKSDLDKLNKYENNTFENAIKERLDSVLNSYLRELNLSYASLLGQKTNKKLLKELCNENKFK